MKDFILDRCPNFGEVKELVKDEKTGKESLYILRRVKTNGVILAVYENGIERDEVVFTQQDLRALFRMITLSPLK
jgi:hypothetical protein